jgi:crotonobetainyl-CoA:carnitine CoA-transferase CaiB-like acyl-CoA transferase
MGKGAGPLDGVRVLEVASSTAGQIAGMLFADLGAHVVAVDPSEPPPIGSLAHPGWLFRNRGKHAVRRLPGPEFRDRAKGPLRRADIVLTDLAPQEQGIWGLDSANVKAEHPSCVHTWMPALSPGGTYRDLPHDELLLDAVSGLAAFHPAHEDRPVASVVPMLEYVHGVLGAFHSSVELVGRERTSQTRPVVVGGLRAAALVLHLMQIEGVDGLVVYSGNKDLAGNAHYRLYQTADDEWVFLAALGDVLFIEALDALDRLDLLARPDVGGDFSNLLRPEVSRAVGHELEATFRTRSAAEWIARFSAADVPLARVGAQADWLASEAVTYACAPLRFSDPTIGAVVMPGAPIELSGGSPAPRFPLPVADLTEASAAWRMDDAGPTRRLEPTRNAPLAGCAVVELATFVAGPVIGSLLAGAGADVVKIESPSGDPYRSYLAAFATLNRGKRHMTIDVSSSAGRDELLHLASSSDVLIDNLRPSSLERRGLTPSVIDRAAPRLIRASVTAFGQSGPWLNSPGFDPILQAMSGLAAVQGGKERPVTTGSPAHDFATGALGAFGVTAALYERERTREGRRVFVSLAATSTFLQAGELTSYAGRAQARTGGPDYAGPSPRHRFYQATDGWIAVRATDGASRRAFDELVGLTDLECDDRSAVEHCVATFATRTTAEWLDLLTGANVPACRVLERDDFADAFLDQAHYFEVIDTEEVGRLRVTRAFVH